MRLISLLSYKNSTLRLIFIPMRVYLQVISRTIGSLVVAPSVLEPAHTYSPASLTVTVFRLNIGFNPFEFITSSCKNKVCYTTKENVILFRT